MSPCTAFASAAQTTTREAEFASASAQYGVPENLLLAISYNQSEWTPNGTNASLNGGFGIMGLTLQGAGEQDGKGALTTPASATLNTVTHYTLNEAAGLLGVSTDTLKENEPDNVRGAAGLLAQYAKSLNGGQLPTSLNDWYGALAEFSGDSSAQTADLFASSVYSILESGESMTTSDGQSMQLLAMPNLSPNTATMTPLHLKMPTPTPGTPTPISTSTKPECPSTLTCNFIPAYYGADSTTDPTNYGNFDYANRPKDIPIQYIYVHDTEGSYTSTVSWIQDPASYVSANYVINTDGTVTQMVPNEDVSWGVNDWYMNPIGINIEHVGFAAEGSTWYTPAMYQASATLVQWLAAKYHIPLDRAHIIGHDNAPTLAASSMPGQHWDPGPFWNWNHYMALIHGVSDAAEPNIEATEDALTTIAESADLDATFDSKLKAITVSPTFAKNQPTVTDCSTTPCTTLPTQGANFVYLHSEPSATSPLISDQYLSTSPDTGTMADSDWGDKAVTGDQYVVAGQTSDWTAIWYGGQEGWFYTPNGANATDYSNAAMVITPKANEKSVNVYGGAYPEASVYPSAVPVQTLSPLYTFDAGQSYVTSGVTPTMYFYDDTWNYSAPDDHAVIIGHEKYYAIMFNHRLGFVKASDVNVSFTM
jgi:N-acetyl-anhydromuramyl-L-alanine amidase AmpD